MQDIQSLHLQVEMRSLGGWTNTWLLEYDVNIDEILMRPDDNFMKNGDIKKLLVEERFNKNYKEIGFLIEDNEESILTFFTWE